MKKQLIKALVIIVSGMILTSCNKSSSSDNPTPAPAATVTPTGAAVINGAKYYATYEITNGCSTGKKVFTANTEQELATQFCNSLKDEAANNNCAAYQRKSAFESLQCEGTWTQEIPNGFNSVSQRNYAYVTESCGTGLHFFSSSDSKSLMRIYCAALQNEEQNRSCSKDKRDEAYNKANCSEAIK